MLSRIDQVDVSYEISGNGKHRILLLHGWGADKSLMQPVRDAMAKSAEEEFTFMTVDFPGHGESGRPPEPWGVPEYASCLLKLLKETSFLPCSVIAHSFGCRVAAWIACNAPETFSRMVLTGAAGIRPPQTPEGRKRSIRYQHLKKMVETAGKIPGCKKAAEEAMQKLRKRFGSADYNALDSEMQKTFVKVIQLDLKDSYPHIHCPTLLVWGDNDTETPLWMGQTMEKLIPDAGLVVFENGTHFAYLEQLRRFTLICTNFLTEASA